MSQALDLQADALLLALVEQNGGDLRAAFVVLCARVALADLNGEPFEAALGRAVADLLARPGARFGLAELPRLPSPRNDKAEP